MAGSDAWWDTEAKAATCLPCHDGPPPIETGIAGGSAATEYRKRSRRETKRKEATIAKDAAWREQVTEAHPIIGRVATLLTPKPVMTRESQATRAWKQGAQGEREVAHALALCEGIVALHDRRVPGSKANIDHLAVGPGGVFVIDAKNYKGEVERRDVGSFFRVDDRLYVGGRDQSKLVEGMEWQVKTVHNALERAGRAEIPLRAVLCFVNADWSIFARPIELGAVTVVWRKKMREIVSDGDALAGADVDAVARLLADAFPPKQ